MPTSRICKFQCFGICDFNDDDEFVKRVFVQEHRHQFAESKRLNEACIGYRAAQSDSCRAVPLSLHHLHLERSCIGYREDRRQKTEDRRQEREKITNFASQI